MGNFKVCKSCGLEKELASGFYAHAAMTDGYLNQCKVCVKSRVKKHREENDSVKEYDRWRYYNNPKRNAFVKKQGVKWKNENPEKYLEGKKRWLEKNPLKRKAHVLVGNAVRDGKLEKQPCSVCGSKISEAHHEDYSKPLEVIWLCKKHHSERHKKYETNFSQIPQKRRFR
jgi:hypothetical protein